MKKMLLVAVVALLSMVSFAQESGSLMVSPRPNPDSPFLLFPTDNAWTFLKLDTRNGRIWQVKPHAKNESQVEIAISESSCVSKQEDEKPGRFFLYPTSNVWTFILIDQYDGRMWRVKCSFDKDGGSVESL